MPDADLDRIGYEMAGLSGQAPTRGTTTAARAHTGQRVDDTANRVRPGTAAPPQSHHQAVQYGLSGRWLKFRSVVAQWATVPCYAGYMHAPCKSCGHGRCVIRNALA